MSTVLIADDVASSRDMFARLLEGEGWTVSTGGHAASAGAPVASPDMIFAHVQTSELDGLALLEGLFEHPRWKALPVVILLSASDTHCICVCQQLASEGYRVKAAFSVSQMLSQIRTYSCPDAR